MGLPASRRTIEHLHRSDNCWAGKKCSWFDETSYIFALNHRAESTHGHLFADNATPILLLK